MDSAYPHDHNDIVTEGWFASLTMFAAIQPGGSVRRGERGTCELIVAVPMPLMNGVISIAAEPDPEEIARFAAAPELKAHPWSIQIRAERFDDRIAKIAAEHGLVQRISVPFMRKELTEADTVLPESAASVRALTAADSALYQRSLAAGFEVPREALTRLVSPIALEHPAVRAYVAEVDGVAVATSFAVFVGETAGVFNVSTPPEHRRRGYGTLASAAVLRDAYAMGARTAFLHSAPPAVSLYERLGFRTMENWTVFHA